MMRILEAIEISHFLRSEANGRPVTLWSSMTWSGEWQQVWEGSEGEMSRLAS